MYGDPLHAARLAQLEGALLALLREAQQEHDCGDEVTATLDADGLHIAYLAEGNEFAGEGV